MRATLDKQHVDLVVLDVMMPGDDVLTQGRDAELFERSIDLLISRVRQRLNEDARTPAYIKTVRSEGYVLSAPVVTVEARE